MRTTSLLFLFLSIPGLGFAQDGFDRMTDPRRDLSSSAPTCIHSQESSQESFVERATGGRTLFEAAFGNETQCLRNKGLIRDGSLSSSNYTTDDDLNNFFEQCTFVQTGEFQDIERINYSIHLQNRDHLVNGLWQDLANRSERQFSCRIDTIQRYHDNPAAKQALDNRVRAKFDQVVDRVRALILSKKRSLARNQREVFQRFDCSGLAWFFCRDVTNVSTQRDIEKHEAAIATEIAKIPYGYEPDVAEALFVMAENGSFDENRFRNALITTQNRYHTLANYYTERRANGKYCIDDEFKKKAVTSGVAQSLLSSYNTRHMSASQRSLVTCNIESKYKVSHENLDQAANVAFMVGGAATAVMTAVPSGGGSLAAFGAIASAGLSAASFAYQVKRSHEACFSKEFTISAEGAETCNPEADFQKEINQPNLTECLTEIGIGALDAVFIPLDISALVRARRSVHVNTLVDDASSAALVDARRSAQASDSPGTVARTANAGEEVAEEGMIVVTGFRTPRFFDRGDYQRLERSLSQKGVTLGEEVSPDVFRSLSSNEKVAVIESLGSSLSRTEGRNLRSFFERYPDGVLPEAQMTELRGILAEGLDTAELGRAQERLDELVEKGFIRAEGSSGRVVSEVPSSGAPSEGLIVRSVSSAPSGSAGLVVRSPADNGLQMTIGPRLDGARDSDRVTDITSGEVRSVGAGEEAIRRFGGDDVSFQDRELILDILLGGPRKSKYVDDPNLRNRYTELETQINRDPNVERFRADVSALAADRIAVGNRLTDEEIADIASSGIKTDGPARSVDCRAFSRVTPGAFPEGGNCRRVKFDEDVDGRYCSCGGMSKTSFTWLVRCPRSGTDFRSLSTYVDELALPSGSVPDMCTRVNIPRGKECYIGPTSATFAGFGGATQILCEHRPPRDPRVRTDRTATAAEIANYEAQLEDIRRFGLDFGGQSVSPVRWSPFSTFTEFQEIINRAAQSCPQICSPGQMQSILQDYDTARAAIRNRGSADDLARLAVEERDFAQYLQELRTGRRPFPGAETRIPSAPVSRNRIRSPLNPEELSQAGSMLDSERLATARRVSGTQFSTEQNAAILRAHNVGEEFGIGNYPPRILAQKARILEEAGIPLNQRRALFENGVVGGNRSVDPTLSPTELRSEGLSLNTQAQNNYRLAGRENDVTKRSELLRSYQSDRRMAGQNFEQSAINGGEGAFSQAAANRTNAAVAYAAAGDVDALIRVLDAGVLNGTGQRNLARAREAVPNDPADPFYGVLRVESDTWAEALSRLESRRPAGATSSLSPSAQSQVRTSSGARRTDASPGTTPDLEVSPITPESIRSLSREESLSRGQAAASAGRHDEAALFFRRASSSERLNDPDYLQAFNESLKGDSSLAQAHLQRALRSQTSAISFITELKNYSMIETMLPRAKENLREILLALKNDRLKIPQTGPYRGWIDDMLNRLPEQPMPTGTITPVSPRGAPSTALSTNRTRPLLTATQRTQAGAMTDAARMDEARRLVGTVTPAQEVAILRAHNLGSEYGIGNYPRPILLQKTRILEEAGLNSQQRRSLMENGVVGGNARNRSRESLIVDDAVDMAETDLQGAINRLTTQDNGVSAKNLIEGPGGLDSRIARLDTQIQSGSTPALIAQRDALVMGRAQLRFSNFRQNIGSQREPLGVTRPESPNVNIREADRYRDSRTFLTETKNGEVTVYRDSPEETRRFVYDLPVYQNLGLGTPPNGWQRIEGSLENTAFFRRPTGYRRMINGREARIRVDWDPTKGAHYNIELPGVDANGRAVTHKLAVGFRCGGRPCTEAEVFDMANELVP